MVFSDIGMSGAKLVRRPWREAPPQPLSPLSDHAYRPGREKIERLEAQVRDWRAENAGRTQQMRELRGQISDLRAMVAEIEEGGTTVDDARIFQIASDITARQAELARIGGIHADKTEQAVALQSVVSSARRNLTAIAPEDVRFMRSPAAKLGANETLSEAIAGVRRKITEINADLHSVRSACLTSAEAKAIARAEVEQLATRGKPDVTAVIESGGSIAWPSANHRAKVFSADPHVVALTAPDSLALVAWLHRDALIAAVESAVEADSDDTLALSEVDRHAKREKLVSELLSREREEEALIELATARGEEIARRPDSDYRAVLSLADEMPAPRERRTAIRSNYND